MDAKQVCARVVLAGLAALKRQGLQGRFVDKDPDYCRRLRQNIQNLSVRALAMLLGQDLLT